MENKLNIDSAMDFIFAGKAFVTFNNTQSGNRFTFKIKKDKKNDSLFYVSVLNGPNNVKDYLYIGAIFNGTFKITPNSRVKADAPSFKVFQYVLNCLKNKNLQEFIHVYHNGRCGRCGDMLTVPESIIRGLGPVCAKLIDKKKASKPNLFSQPGK